LLKKSNNKSIQCDGEIAFSFQDREERRTRVFGIAFRENKGEKIPLNFSRAFRLRRANLNIGMEDFITTIMLLE
jgi:hypothetical protein